MTIQELIDALIASGAPLDTPVGGLHGCNFPDDIHVGVEELYPGEFYAFIGEGPL